MADSKIKGISTELNLAMESSMQGLVTELNIANDTYLNGLITEYTPIISSMFEGIVTEYVSLEDKPTIYYAFKSGGSIINNNDGLRLTGEDKPNID